MYESFFELQERPFTTTPRVERYFPAAAIEAARDTLSRTIERAEGIGLVMGPAGSGKTLLLNVLAKQYADRFTVVSIADLKLSSRRALLQAILFEAGLSYRRMEEGELRLTLLDYLRPNEKCPHGMLILFDECHTLAPKILEELRLLTNVVREGQPRVRLVLAGGSVMEERFGQPRMQSFQQRITARCYLDLFSHNETLGYIKSQLAAAGGDWASVITEKGLSAVHQASDGVPRVINQICDHAMIMAAAAGVRPIEAAGIEEAWADLQQLPLPWNLPKDDSDETAHAVEFGTLDDDEEDVEWNVEESTAWQPLGHAEQPGVRPPHLDLADDDLRTVEETEHKLEKIVEPTEQLDRIARHLAEVSHDFYPPGRHRPEIVIDTFNNADIDADVAAPAAANPFENDGFEEEEVVLNPTAEVDPSLFVSDVRCLQPPSKSRDSDLESAATVPFAQTIPGAKSTTVEEHSGEFPGQKSESCSHRTQREVMLCDDVVLPQIELADDEEVDAGDARFAPAEDPVLPEDRLERGTEAAAGCNENWEITDHDTDEQATLPLHSFVKGTFDGDMIIIEEDVATEEVPCNYHRDTPPQKSHIEQGSKVAPYEPGTTDSHPSARQQEYRNLFARLRRGE